MQLQDSPYHAVQSGAVQRLTMYTRNADFHRVGTQVRQHIPHLQRTPASTVI